VPSAWILDPWPNALKNRGWVGLPDCQRIFDNAASFYLRAAQTSRVRIALS